MTDVKEKDIKSILAGIWLLLGLLGFIFSLYKIST